MNKPINHVAVCS